MKLSLFNVFRIIGTVGALPIDVTVTADNKLETDATEAKAGLSGVYLWKKQSDAPVNVEPGEVAPEDVIPTDVIPTECTLETEPPAPCVDSADSYGALIERAVAIYNGWQANSTELPGWENAPEALKARAIERAKAGG